MKEVKECNLAELDAFDKVTGYLTGDLSTWGNAKIAEEKDRVKHA